MFNVLCKSLNVQSLTFNVKEAIPPVKDPESRIVEYILW